MLYCLKYSQKVPISLKEAWDFFSSPHNLKLLTPTYLNFEIQSFSRDKIYAGQIIEYMIRPLANIPLAWVTEITHVKEMEYFVDEQRFGPYSFWHHEHHFSEIPGGVLISDIVYYKVPLGPLGKLLHKLKIEKDVKNIFTYRNAKLVTLFGQFPV